MNLRRCKLYSASHGSEGCNGGAYGISKNEMIFQLLFHTGFGELAWGYATHTQIPSKIQMSPR